jgi:hypothetical protein
MIMQPCPTVLNCTQVVNIGEGAKNNLLNLSQYQYCGVDSNKSAPNPETGKDEPTLAVENVNKIVDSKPVPQPVPQPTVTPVIPPVPSTSDDDNNKLYAAIFIVAVLLVGGIYVANKPKTVKQ